MHVGFIHWEGEGELARAQVETIEAIGHRVTGFYHAERIPSHVDMVFAHGPFGSLAPIGNQLHALPSSRRPPFVLWMSEQLWNPKLPTIMGGILSRLRTILERNAFQQSTKGLWQLKSRWRWPTTKALRFRYYGDIQWLQREDVLSVVAVPSDRIVNFLKQRGIRAILARNGYFLESSADLGLKRDIKVLWLGKPVSRRRSGLLRRIRRRLRQRGVEMLVIDGIENGFVFGAERTRLLNRTKIVLNLLRKPWDSNYLRYLLAMPNRALVVTEPTYPHAPFLNNVHLAVAPHREIVETICYYLSHEEQREAITTQAYEFVTTKFTMQQGMAPIFEYVERLKPDVLHAA